MTVVTDQVQSGNIATVVRTPISASGGFLSRKRTGSHSTIQSVKPFPCCTSFSANSFPAVSLRSQGRESRPTTIVRHLLVRAN